MRRLSSRLLRGETTVASMLHRLDRYQQLSPILHRDTKAYWCVPRPAVARRAWQVLRLWPRVTLPSKGSQGIILHGAYLEYCSIRGLVHFFGDGGATAYLPSAVLDSLVLRKFELRTAARPLLQVGKPDSAAATGIAPRT